MVSKLLIALLAFVVLAAAAYDRTGNDQYNRLKYKCTQQCEPKGYTQEVCVRMCLSYPCFRKVYQNESKPFSIKGILEPGQAEDPNESLFRKCWLSDSELPENIL